MPDPSSLSANIAQVMTRHPTGRLHDALAGVLAAHEANQRRREAVLADPELRDMLTGEPFNFRYATDWNGYIPPLVMLDDDGGLLRSARLGANSQIEFRYNQRGRRSCGEKLNQTAYRLGLLVLSEEAYRRRSANAGND
jgi:hypothetical protein